MSAEEVQEPPFAVDRASPVALYQQIAGWLERRIADGRLRAGDRLEPEHTLTARLGVSRITVRDAIDDLAGKGLVVRRQGKGTFVVAHPMRHDLQELHPFFDALFAHGQRPEAQLLTFAPGRPPPEIATLLALGAGEEAVEIRRRYMVDGQPAGVAYGWLTPAARPVARSVVERVSTTTLLQDILGLRIVSHELAIRSALAGRAAGRDLDVPPRSPVLQLVRTSFDAAGRCIRYSRFAMKPDAYEFVLKSRGSAESASALKLISAA